MLIKHAELGFQFSKQLPALYILLGQELFQINQMNAAIRNIWRKRYADDSEIKQMTIDSSDDWALLKQETGTYSLFSNYILYDIRYDKKTLEPAGKEFFNEYLQEINKETLLLLQAPNLGVKQVQAFCNMDSVQVVLFTPPNAFAVKQWINRHLASITPAYDREIPDLIYQYNQGNLSACKQVLEKLKLIVNANEPLSLLQVEEQLINQCTYPLFSLADACLAGDMLKVMALLKQAANDKTEPSLVLWILCQELRLLMQYLYLSHQNKSTQEIASSLKIWSSRLRYYETASKKYTEAFLRELLKFCGNLDVQIKTSQGKQIWQSFELVALSLCSGKRMIAL